MKFLFTSDWHIGIKAAHVGAAADRVRAERLETAKKIIDLAADRKCDCILVGGDQFDDNAVNRRDIQKTADILGSFDGPVYIIPGNHDPFVTGSVWEHPAWSRHENLTVFCKSEPVPMEWGVLYPCPVLQRWSYKDPVSWIRHDPDKGIGLGLAHGSVRTLPVDNPDLPIHPDAPATAKLDFLALGHYHSTVGYPDSEGTVRMMYCGTHEPTGFGDVSRGNVLVVEISGPGAAPSIETVHTAGLQWPEIRSETASASELEQLRDQLEKMPEPDRKLINIVLSGAYPLDAQPLLDHIGQILASRFLYGCMDVSGLYPSPGSDEWIDRLPDGVPRQTGIRLLELADPSFAGRRPEGATAAVAARALLELYILSGGSGA